jgi:hypothetical protein
VILLAVPRFAMPNICDGQLDTYSHAIPAMQAGAVALIAGLVFAGK